MRNSRAPAALLPILLGALFAAAPARSAGPDWNTVASVETVEIVTTNEDGTPKETTIWLVVVDGEGYVRTGSTRWKANIDRDKDVTLRIEGSEYPLRVEFATDAELRARVEQAFRDKYGFSDSFIDIFRSGDSNIMRLLPR